jgi:putative heme-binding domain-containing protein
VLLSLLNAPHPEQDEIRALALKHVSSTDVASEPGVRTVLGQTLASFRGTETFVDLVARFDMRDHNEDLVQIVRDQPESEVALEAVRQLLRLGGDAMIERNLAQSDTEGSMALVTALGRFEDTRSKDILEGVILDGQADLSVRRVAVQGLGRGWSGEPRLLALVQEGRLPPELKSAAADVLLRASRGVIRDAATQHLGMSGPAEGSERPAIHELAARIGDPSAGKEVFDRVCRSCHVANGTGTDFGPELSAIGSKLPGEALYLAVLDPDAGISFGYEGSEVRLRDGSQVAGIVASETSGAIELRLLNGVTERYNKDDVTSITKLEHSLMPPNLHQEMTEQELVDLIEYLTTLRQVEP